MILIYSTCESAQKYVKDFPPFKFFSNHLKSTAGAIKQSTKCYNVTPEGNTRFTPIKPENAVHIDEISSNASGALFIGITLIFFYYVGTSFLSSAILKPFNLSKTWLSRIDNLIEWQCKGATIWLFMQVCEAWAKEDKENAELKLLKTRPGPSSDNTPITPETSVPDDLSTFARYNWLCPSFFKDFATTLMTSCNVKNDESKSNAESALIFYTTVIAITYIAWSTIVSKSCQHFNLSKKLTASLHKTFAEWPLQACMIGTILKTFNVMGELGEKQLQEELQRQEGCQNLNTQ